VVARRRISKAVLIALIGIVSLLGPLAGAGEESSPSSAVLLNKALGLYSQFQFAQAKSLLATVDRASLSDDDVVMLDRYLKWADAAQQRQDAARQLLADGKQAVAEGDLARAKACYAQAAACEFLQPDGRQTARDQLAEVGKLLGTSRHTSETVTILADEATDETHAAPVVVTPDGPVNPPVDEPTDQPADAGAEKTETPLAEETSDALPVFDLPDPTDETSAVAASAVDDATDATDLETLAVDADRPADLIADAAADVTIDAATDPPADSASDGAADLPTDPPADLHVGTVATIELPDVALGDLPTTVTIPEGGTLLPKFSDPPADLPAAPASDVVADADSGDEVVDADSGDEVIDADSDDEGDAPVDSPADLHADSTTDQLDAEPEFSGLLADATFMAAAVTAEDLETADVVSGAGSVDGPVDDTASSGQDESTLTRLELKRRLAAQEARVVFNLAMKRALERDVSANTAADFQAAREAVAAAMDILEKRKHLLPPEGYRQKLAEAQNRLRMINAHHRTWEIEQAEKKGKELKEAEEKRKKEMERRRRQKVDTLQDRAGDLLAQRRYDQALEIVDEIIKLQPRHTFAVGQRDLLRELVLLTRQKGVIETISLEQRRSLLSVQSSEIPWEELLTFGPNWRELSYRRRQAFGRTREFASEEDRRAHLILQRKIGKMEFDDIALEDFIRYLRDYLPDADIDVRWNALAAMGLDRRTPVGLYLGNPTLEQALRVVLKKLSDPNPVWYAVQNGVITISSLDDLRDPENMITRLYDVQDLIFRVPDFAGPRLDVAEVLATAGEEGGGGFITDEDEEDIPEPTRREMLEQLIEVIKTSIDPESWNTGAELTQHLGQLTIKQTPENHRKIIKLLDDFRASRAVEISIEARFIEVTTGFLERVGVDMDILLNVGSSQSGTMRLLDAGGAPVTPPPLWAISPSQDADWFVGYARNDPKTGLGIERRAGRQDAWSNRFSPIAVESGNKLAFVTIGTGVAGDFGSGTTGVPTALNIAGAFLDDIEVSFIIEATQGSETTRILTAPRLTLYNGQRSYVTVGTQTAYIKGWEPLVAEGSAALKPIIGYIPTGSVLDVEATVSADRRYVTMTIRPQVADLQGAPRQIQFAVGSGLNVGTVATIELPEVALQDLSTTVTVPDRGTLLLGGQKLAGQVEREVGPPVLSKIPILNRFFTARGTVRDERTLLILVKPEIIIQREREEEAGY